MLSPYFVCLESLETKKLVGHKTLILLLLKPFLETCYATLNALSIWRVALGSSCTLFVLVVIRFHLHWNATSNFYKGYGFSKRPIIKCN